MRLPNAGSVGPWLSMHCRPAPLAAERPPCPQGTHVRNFRSILELASISSPSRDYINHIFPTGSHTLNPFAFTGKRINYFFGPELEQNRIIGDRIFIRVIAHERHFRCRASAHSSNFGHARATSELAGWRSSFLFFCFGFAWFVPS